MDDPYNVPRFDYSSPFTYQRGVDIDDAYHQLVPDTDGPRKQSMSLSQSLAYFSMVSLSSLFLFCTFPITAFYSLKKVDSLQRCLIYRLGQRLPTKGPGFILTLPFIDKACVVDLNDVQFDLIDHGQHILTSDGSIISLEGSCRVTLSIINAWLTTLKTNSVDHRDWLRIRFTNLLCSTDVEDLEMKLDFTCKAYEESCNRILKNWGYAVRLDERPKFSIIKRADRMAPIQNKLKQYFNLDGSKQSCSSEGQLFATLLGDVGNASEQDNHEMVELSSDAFTNAIHRLKQCLVSLLCSNSMMQWFSSAINLQLIVEQPHYIRYFRFEQHSIVDCLHVPACVDCTLCFKTRQDLIAFAQGNLEKPDWRLVDISLGDHIPMKSVITNFMQQQHSIN